MLENEFAIQGKHFPFPVFFTGVCSRHQGVPRSVEPRGSPQVMLSEEHAFRGTVESNPRVRLTIRLLIKYQYPRSDSRQRNACLNDRKTPAWVVDQRASRPSQGSSLSLCPA